MPDPDDLAIAVVPRALDTISAKGDDRIGFAVTRLNNPGGLLGVLVSADIVTPAGAGFPEDASPQLSADGQQWSSGADKRTDASGLAWFYIRSRSSAGKFQVSGAIGDAKAPFHKVHASLVAKGSVVEVEFAPKTSLTTWQGEAFTHAAAIHVKTVPDSKLGVTLRLAGPDKAQGASENNAHFLTGPRQEATVVSGRELPPIQAGKRIGEVTITPSAGGHTGKPLTWHVLPVPDRLTNDWGTTPRHMSMRAAVREGVVLPFRLSGHKTLGDSTGEPDSIVPVGQWAIQLSLDATPHAKFKDGSTGGGNSLILRTDASGIASIPAGALQIQASARNQTITIHAAWSKNPTNAGPWAPSPQDGAISIYFDP
ncbi:hypothetical protein [Achromobacter sp. EB05]|uniref:hypothetical protein n=1 Tax=Achromobacter sp. EB05 TaxID=3142974 RepID=UPI0037834146